MEKYEALEIEIVEFEDEDVVTASNPKSPTTPAEPFYLSERTLLDDYWNEEEEE